MKSAIIGWQIAFALVVAVARTAESAALYHLTDLAEPSFMDSSPVGINNTGQVVGDAHVNGNGRAFLHDNGTITVLPTLGGDNAGTGGINSTGQIAGSSQITGDAVADAFIYSGGVLTDLGQPFGGTQLSTYAINNSGQIAGAASLTGDMASHAFRYNNGMMQDLGTLGGSTSIAYGINSAGDVVGESQISGDGDSHAFIVKNGTMSDLGTLGGSYSYAYGINGAGQIVGVSGISPFQGGWDRAFIYSNGTMTDLGSLGGRTSYAFGINASGQVVGTSELNELSTVAFVYADKTMYNLSNLLDSSGTGWQVLNAVAINDNGWIIAEGIFGTNQAQHAVLLTPVTPALVRGDFNQDGHVTAADVSAMVKALTDLNAYKLKNGLFDANLNTIGDFDGDGMVTNADLQLLLTLLKSGGGSLSAVPEPQSIGLAAAACVAFLGMALHRQRRERA
jgi:probable HAF family extracellular repeat protein